MGEEWCVAASEAKTKMKPWAPEVINGKAVVQQDQVQCWFALHFGCIKVAPVEVEELVSSFLGKIWVTWISRWVNHVMLIHEKKCLIDISVVQNCSIWSA